MVTTTIGKRMAGLLMALCVAFSAIQSPAETLRLAPSEPTPTHATSWKSYSVANLPQRFPGIQTLDQNVDIPTLKRVLSRTALNPESLQQQESKTQAALISSTIKDYAEFLTIDSPMPSTENPAEEIIWLNDKNNQLKDLRAIVRFFIRDGNRRDILLEKLERRKQTINKQIWARSEALVNKVIYSLSQPDAVIWYGRTAVISLDDGHKLALKHSRKSTDESKNQEFFVLNQEGEYMQEANLFGLNNLIPLVSENSRWHYAKSHEHLTLKDRPPGLGDHFLPYLIPKEMDKDYFSYLGDPLPEDMSVQEKAKTIEKAALKGIDDMILLLENGRLHTSLAPISHSEANWRWNYWRLKFFSFPTTPFGPTSLHNWKSALSYANLRLCGMADFEHIIKTKNRSPNSFINKYDQNDTDIIGQNLTEWALLVIRSGIENGLKLAETARILAQGIKRHAANQLSSGTYELDLAKMTKSLHYTARWFYMFHFVAAILPRSITPILNIFSSPNLAIPKDELLVMPGEVMYPLIMNVIWPYTEALRGLSPQYKSQYEIVKGTSAYNKEESSSEIGAMATAQLFSGVLLWVMLLGFFSIGLQNFANPLLWHSIVKSQNGFILFFFSPLLIPLGRFIIDTIYIICHRYQSPWIKKNSKTDRKDPH